MELRRDPASLGATIEVGGASQDITPNDCKAMACDGSLMDWSGQRRAGSGARRFKHRHQCGAEDVIWSRLVHIPSPGSWMESFDTDKPTVVSAHWFPLPTYSLQP